MWRMKITRYRMQLFIRANDQVFFLFTLLIAKWLCKVIYWASIDLSQNVHLRSSFYSIIANLCTPGSLQYTCCRSSHTVETLLTYLSLQMSGFGSCEIKIMHDMISCLSDRFIGSSLNIWSQKLDLWVSILLFVRSGFCFALLFVLYTSFESTTF